jgi:hypothetical protein
MIRILIIVLAILAVIFAIWFFSPATHGQAQTWFNEIVVRKFFPQLYKQLQPRYPPYGPAMTI